MEVRKIENDKQYQDALEWVGSQFDLNISLESEQGRQLNTALEFIKEYEDKHYSVRFKEPSARSIL